MQVDSCYNSGLDTVCPVSVFRPSSHHHKLSHFVSLLPDAMSWPDGEEEERSGEGRGWGWGVGRREKGVIAYILKDVEKCSLWHCL